MSCLVAFHYRSYGTFFYTKIGSIRAIGDLPTTNIIEPAIYAIIVSMLKGQQILSFLGGMLRWFGVETGL
ncbi:hypothetical protein [Streptococcus agalactiae]|uniref:hypothetical protein n=1 Tax=Streptococcus agalactiae TaxID=1311 RepID=UPI0039F65097